MRTINPVFPLIILLFAIFLFSCNKITNPDGSTISNISITALQPAHGPFGTIDTLIGKGFDQIPTLDSVLLNGKKLTVISRSDGQVIVSIPALAGTGHIEIGYKGQLIRGPLFTYDSTLWVTTLAGSELAGTVDATGLDARFYFPSGIAVDGSGNIYASDWGNSSIRKITPDGVVTTLAGPLTREEGFMDGAGSAARFGAPRGLSIDGNGVLYVADYNNFRVRKVTPSGIVSTMAGNIWYGGPLSGEIDGDTSVATFDSPYGVSVDGQGNVFVVDINNNRIRKITAAGVVSTFAGGDYYHFGQQDGQGSAALFFDPSAVCTDIFGNVYVIDSDGQLIRKITPDGTVSTILGRIEPSITGADAVFSAGALATDKYGNLFFSIPYGIIKRTPDGTIIHYAVGGIGDNDGPAETATYRAITAIAVDNNTGNLYIADDSRIRKIGWQ